MQKESERKEKISEPELTIRSSEKDAKEFIRDFRMPQTYRFRSEEGLLISDMIRILFSDLAAWQRRNFLRGSGCRIIRREFRRIRREEQTDRERTACRNTMCDAGGMRRQHFFFSRATASPSASSQPAGVAADGARAENIRTMRPRGMLWR